jgi:hypothetical protein
LPAVDRLQICWDLKSERTFQCLYCATADELSGPWHYWLACQLSHNREPAPWLSLQPTANDFLACGFFCPEDGGDTFLRNVYTAPDPRKLHPSYSSLWQSQIFHTNVSLPHCSCFTESEVKCIFQAETFSFFSTEKISVINLTFGLFYNDW